MLNFVALEAFWVTFGEPGRVLCPEAPGAAKSRRVSPCLSALRATSQCEEGRGLIVQTTSAFGTDSSPPPPPPHLGWEVSFPILCRMPISELDLDTCR